ncbi:unnamed protein product [Nezara viridula]|uniref:Isopropylmalate dehydrogenase-like domain-containing protein n=1 Tax=Nezara viridula TaxID=85310 RepID=A0A9P0MQC4_NEZVI|nr:unnamed protein product [Nezara viridula]
MNIGTKIRPLINYCKRSYVVPWKAIKYEKKGRKERKLEKYGGKFNLAIIMGIGKSRDLMRALEDLLRCCGAPLAWEMVSEKIEDDKSFENMIMAIKRNGVAIKGNLDKETVFDENFLPEISKNMAVKRVLDLHSVITEFKSFQGLEKKMKIHRNVDLVIVRQNTEGDYMMLEHSPSKKIAEHLRVITLNNSERVSETAFQYAEKKNRRKIYCLHKRRVLPLSEKVFIDGFLLAASKYPHIPYEIMDVNQGFRAFLKNPKALDVVVTNSLDGTMLKSVLLGMFGSPSLVAGSNIGDDAVVFEPAVRYKSLNFENPTAHFLSGVLLLEHLGLSLFGDAIRKSLEEVFLDGAFTKDLGGNETLSTFTTKVIEKLQKKVPYTLCAYNKIPSITCSHKPIDPYQTIHL